MNLQKTIFNLVTASRQFLFPREFRIGQAAWPDDCLETLRKLAELPPIPSKSQDDMEQIRLLANLGTGIWRLRQKMLEPGTERPKEQFRREYRDVESIWDFLRQAGIEIKDHTGQPFDSGLVLKVLAFQPTPGVKRERVQETIKPTIYFKGRHIQVGEVIVDSPEKNKICDNSSMGAESPEKSIMPRTPPKS